MLQILDPNMTVRNEAVGVVADSLARYRVDLVSRSSQRHSIHTEDSGCDVYI
jgi:hypothetical protein